MVVLRRIHKPRIAGNEAVTLTYKKYFVPYTFCKAYVISASRLPSLSPTFFDYQLLVGANRRIETRPASNRLPFQVSRERSKEYSTQRRADSLNRIFEAERGYRQEDARHRTIAVISQQHLDAALEG